MLQGESVNRVEILERAVSKAVCQFQLDFMAGSFAEDIRVIAVPDMIIVRSKGALPTVEQRLAHSEEGQSMVKQLYRTLFAPHRLILMNQVAALSGREVTEVLTDFSLSTSEQVIILLLAPHHEN